MISTVAVFGSTDRTVGGFQGDPMLEYQQEQIDSANYLGVMLSDGVISDEEFRLGYKNAFEAWWWIETKRERQGG